MLDSSRVTFKLGSTLLIVVVAFSEQLLSENVERGRWEDVLKLVSTDVQKNFYDPQMRGLDWAALTEETRQRIRSSNNTGQMILAICTLLGQLHDSHTYFVPPRLTALADFGFKARAYGSEVRVYEITKKGPAERSGLQIGDAILSLNGVPLDRSNIREILWLVTSVVPATALDLEVGTARPQAVHIPARLVTSQEHEYIESVWRVADWQRARDVHVNFSHRDYGTGISYIGIPSFTASPELTYSEISGARRANVLILDLRANSGGWEETLTTFLGFFTDQPTLMGKVVSRSQSQDWLIKPKTSGFHGSIIVLVDSDSASAAELAARYLQMFHRATILGDLTSGMVNRGRVFEEKIGAGFVMPFATMVTSAKLVMPNGEELEGRGVIPDIKCVPTREDLIHRADPCLDQALAFAKKLQSQSDVQ